MKLDIFKLKNYRLENNLTQKKVANFLGISNKHYSAIERGARKLRLDKAIMLAKLYGVTVVDFFS